MSSAIISFTFPLNAAYKDVIAAVNKHYEQVVNEVVHGGAIGADDAPDTGIRNPAEVFAQGTVQQGAIYTGQPAITQQTSTPPQIDADHLPWDERIHSSSKGLTAKGVWVKRKNVPDATYNAIRAELVARANAQTQPAQSNVPPSSGPHITEHEQRVRAAWAQATQQVGNYPGSIERFEALKKGTPITVSPDELIYFNTWQNAVKDILRAGQTQQVAANPGTFVPPGASPLANSAPAATVGSNFDPNTYPGFAMFVMTAVRSGRITQEALNETIKMAGVVDAQGNGSLAAVGNQPHMIPSVYGLLDALYQLTPG
jgi:hypothetical protein